MFNDQVPSLVFTLRGCFGEMSHTNFTERFPTVLLLYLLNNQLDIFKCLFCIILCFFYVVIQ